MSDNFIKIKKERILEAYGNHPSWVAKVEKMSDKQIHAIFMRMFSKGQVKGI